MSESDADWSTGATRIPLGEDIETVAPGVKVGGAGNSYTLDLAPQPESPGPFFPPFGFGDLLLRAIVALVVMTAAGAVIAMAVMK